MIQFNSFVVRIAAGYALLLAALLPFPSAGQTPSVSDSLAETHFASNGAKVIEIAAAPAVGFNFPYLLFLPPNVDDKNFGYMLVEPNNSAIISDDLSAQRPSAIDQAAVNSDGNSVALNWAHPFSCQFSLGQLWGRVICIPMPFRGLRSLLTVDHSRGLIDN